MRRANNRLARLGQARGARGADGVALALAAPCGRGGLPRRRHADRTPAYNRVDEARRYLPPAAVRWFSGAAAFPGVSARAYPLGSDNLGRDVLARVVQGTRIAFHVGIVTSLIALPLGVALGCLGGYFGGRVDSVVIWLCATVASMPGLLFILAVALVVGQGLAGLYLGIGLTTWVGVCRNVRAETIKHRDRPYVEAARVLATATAHFVPHILRMSPYVLICFSCGSLGGATECLSLSGIGVQNEPSWGVMINNARLRLWQGVWWEMASVSVAIFALVMSFNILADALRDALDPALRTGD